MRDRPATDLFLISWLVLFLELACLRWFPAHVLFLSFFTNTVLLACFVGMSIGCLVARRRTDLIRTTPYFLALAVGAGLAFDAYTQGLAELVAVGDQANPDEVFFGTEHTRQEGFTIPIEVIGGLFYILIASLMVGPGQEMGRAFNRVPSRTQAYSANLIGSVVGIGMFAGFSYIAMPPVVWFGLSIAVIGYLMVRVNPDHPDKAQYRSPVVMGVGVVLLLATFVMTSYTSGFFTGSFKQLTVWSRYYRVDFYSEDNFINVNAMSQQVMEPVDSPSVAPYALPYLFQRDVKKPDGSPAWPEFRRVLIIGAGSGNDVARALRWLPPDARVDAVEIDPKIQQIGEEQHPDRPFQDPRVHVYLNDGRNFLRESPPEQYDLVLYALIDSLVLQSGYSALRLENFLFTTEAFEDVRRVMKPSGVFAVYNFFRQGFIACRIRDQLRSAFGENPVVMTAPPRADIPINLFEKFGFTTFFAGQKEVLDPLRAAFADRTLRLWSFEFPDIGPEVRYWYPWKTGVPKDTPARFSVLPPADPPEALGEINPDDPPQWMGMQIAIPDEPGDMRQATDDWPFLYTRQARIPELTRNGIIMMLVLSILLWFAFLGHKCLGSVSAETDVGPGGAKPEWGLMFRAFCLGAGFMLVETKAIVQVALLFGGTWMVYTVVFAAILIMSLLGNLYAGWVQPRRLEPYYIGLFLALGVGVAVPINAFLGLNPTLQTITVCVLVFTPIAFAGVVFATSFRRTAQPDRVFGANVGGALVGGLAENTSVVLGFQLLLCVAIGFYALSALAGNREVPSSAAENGV